MGATITALPRSPIGTQEPRSTGNYGAAGTKKLCAPPIVGIVTKIVRSAEPQNPALFNSKLVRISKLVRKPAKSSFRRRPESRRAA